MCMCVYTCSHMPICGGSVCMPTDRHVRAYIYIACICTLEFTIKHVFLSPEVILLFKAINYLNLHIGKYSNQYFY